jgi:hypothetical protein
MRRKGDTDRIRFRQFFEKLTDNGLTRKKWNSVTDRISRHVVNPPRDGKAFTIYEKLKGYTPVSFLRFAPIFTNVKPFPQSVTVSPHCARSAWTKPWNSFRRSSMCSCSTEAVSYMNPRIMVQCALSTFFCGAFTASDMPYFAAVRRRLAARANLVTSVWGASRWTRTKSTTWI